MSNSPVTEYCKREATQAEIARRGKKECRAAVASVQFQRAIAALVSACTGICLRRGGPSSSKAGLATARSNGSLLDQCLHFLRPKSGLREHIR